MRSDREKYSDGPSVRRWRKSLRSEPWRMLYNKGWRGGFPSATKIAKMAGIPPQRYCDFERGKVQLEPHELEALRSAAKAYEEEPRVTLRFPRGFWL